MLNSKILNKNESMEIPKRLKKYVALNNLIKPIKDHYNKDTMDTLKKIQKRD